MSIHRLLKEVNSFSQEPLVMDMIDSINILWIILFEHVNVDVMKTSIENRSMITFIIFVCLNS